MLIVVVANEVKEERSYSTQAGSLWLRSYGLLACNDRCLEDE